MILLFVSSYLLIYYKNFSVTMSEAYIYDWYLTLKVFLICWIFVIYIGKYQVFLPRSVLLYTMFFFSEVFVFGTSCLLMTFDLRETFYIFYVIIMAQWLLLFILQISCFIHTSSFMVCVIVTEERECTQVEWVHSLILIFWRCCLPYVYDS